MLLVSVRGLSLVTALKGKHHPLPQILTCLRTEGREWICAAGLRAAKFSRLKNIKVCTQELPGSNRLVAGTL